MLQLSIRRIRSSWAVMPGGIWQAQANGANGDGTDDGELETNVSVFISRWTFVIDKDGKIAYKNEKANVSNDAQKVLEALDKLEK